MRNDVSFGDSWWHYVPGVGQAGDLAQEVTEAFDDRAVQSWWITYAAGNESQRQQLALDAWQQGELRHNIVNLSHAQQVDPALYGNELGEVLDTLQQFEMMRAAGMTWEQMVAAQGSHMRAEAETRARAANPGTDPITEADLQDAHEEGVADQDYLGEEDTTWWDGLSAAQQTSWNQRGARAVTIRLAHAQRTRPDLNIQASEIAVDIPGNSNSVAYVDGAGKCWIGETTIEAIEVDPAYADSTIMHELRGHPEFDTGFALSMELYDGSAGALPGYTRPADGTDERYDEWLRFEYLESEIGALMREEAFWIASRDQDGDGTVSAAEQNPLGSPGALLDTLLGNLSSQFAPSLLEPFLKGLARRFEADPRVTQSASTMFAATCLRQLGVTV